MRGLDPRIHDERQRKMAELTALLAAKPHGLPGHQAQQ
jgi:hypothetical protein